MELNSWLVAYSRVSALMNGVSNKTAFFRKDLWKLDLSKYDYITVFGVEQMVFERISEQTQLSRILQISDGTI